MERGARNVLVSLILGMCSYLVPFSLKRNAFLLRSLKNGPRSRERRSQERVPNALADLGGSPRPCPNAVV